MKQAGADRDGGLQHLASAPTPRPSITALQVDHSTGAALVPDPFS